MSSLILPQTDMAYHGSNTSFPGRIEKRHQTVGMRSGEFSFPSRSPSGISRDNGPHVPWTPPEALRPFNDRIASPPHGQTAAATLREQARFTEPRGFYSNFDILPRTTSSYDQHPHIPPPLMPKPTGEQLQPAPYHGGNEFLTSFSNDSRVRERVSSPPELDSLSELVKKRPADGPKNSGRFQLQRRGGNRDEFDGPTQLLQLPAVRTTETQEEDLPRLPTTLDIQEQDRILFEVNDRLSQCAFNFIAKYQFPIPAESDKKPVLLPRDREWTEWVYLLKRLATKRRIPARVLYNGQIKQFVTVLENSLETRHTTNNQYRPLKDDRNILQFISAGTQVAKLFKDAPAMEYFDWLYTETEKLTQERRTQPGHVPRS